MRGIWTSYDMPPAKKAGDEFHEDSEPWRRTGLFSLLALFGVVGCAASEPVSSFDGGGYNYYGRGSYYRSPGRRYRYGRRGY